MDENNSQETKVLPTPLQNTSEIFDTEINKVPVIQQLVLLAVMLLLVFGSTITPKIFALLQKNDTTSASLPLADEQSSNVIQSDSNADNPFLDIVIAAKSAYVWDISSQKALFKKSESTQLPLASIAKLMTALVAQEVLDESQPIKIDGLSIRQDGDSGLFVGEIFERLTLSDLVLMSSSNDGAYALAAAAGSMLSTENGANSFVNAMNIRAKEIGLLETYFKNPTGLDLSQTEGGAYGSARDMAFLMEYIVINYPTLLEFTLEDKARVYSKSGQYHDTENTNYYIDDVPGLIGSKTGYTDLAGGNLVIAFNVGLNRPIVAVVLGSTSQERFTDMLQLVAATNAYITKQIQH